MSAPLSAKTRCAAAMREPFVVALVSGVVDGPGTRVSVASAIRMLRDKGFTTVMVEQNFRFAAPLADRFYVIEHGRVVESFTAAELDSRSEMLKTYLGV